MLYSGRGEGEPDDLVASLPVPWNEVFWEGLLDRCGGRDPVVQERVVAEGRGAVEFEDVQFGSEDGGDVALRVGVRFCRHCLNIRSDHKSCDIMLPSIARNSSKTPNNRTLS